MARQGTVRSEKRPVRQAVQARSRNTIEAIVEATARILTRDGWPACNTNAIARVAGVSIGSVYEYFKNKEAILELILDRHLTSGEAKLAGLSAAARGGLPLDDVVRLLVEGFVAVHSDNPRLHRVLSAEVPISGRQRQRIAQIRSGAIALLAGLLVGRVERPELRATMMIDAADALTHRWFVDERGVAAKPGEMTRELQQMLRSYLGQ